MNSDAKKRACLIGLGKITEHYRAGLENSQVLRLCAVSDLDEAAFGRKYYEEYPFYTDYKTMVDEQNPDFVIISVPPMLHFEIASYCLKSGINVIVEKPVVLNIEEFDELIALARQKDLVFRTLFHWHGGIETIAFTQNYDHKDFEEINVSVHDPYAMGTGIIASDRRPLMGAWVDSGINILSMLHLWLPFEKVEIVNVTTDTCKETGMPVFASVDLVIDGVKTAISIDWRENIEHKESFVKLQGRTVHINHSAQSIVDGEATVYGRMPRLAEHYFTLFTSFDGTSNSDFSRTVHEILFKVNEEI